MLARLLPRSCSALSVFVSYSHEQRALGEEIAQALKNAGHTVFFDRDSIPAAGDYIESIRSAIESADRFVFLASREALAPGKFTMTEVGLAKERWPVPEGKVFPVLVDKSVGVGELPVYLRSISVMSVEGHAPTEIVTAIGKTRRLGALCKTVTAGALAAAIGAGAWVATGGALLDPRLDVRMLPVDVVHFRSAAEAPYPADAPGAGTGWTNSPLTITFSPVAYAHRTEPGRRVRVLAERAELQFDGKTFPYKAQFVVEITDQRCGDKWFCIKGNAQPETLEPGKTISRETMFFGDGATVPTWRAFVEAIQTKAAPPVTVTLTARVDESAGGDAPPREMRIACTIDTGALRKGMEQQGFQARHPLKPVYLQGDCRPPS